MGRRKKFPEDLMGVILGEGSGAPGEGRTLLEPRGTDRKTSSPPDGGEGTFSWEEQPGRVGVTFNLSKQLAAELERLRQGAWPEGDARPSRSEIAEVALRIAVEDAREGGAESDLLKRLDERRARQTAGGTDDEAGPTTARRSIDESGFIVETTYDENGEIVDEDVVGSVSDLPVEDEFLDDEGRIISRVRDEETGTLIEQILDDRGNTIGVKILKEG